MGRRQKEKLFERQRGVSTFTGKNLDMSQGRLEVHHIEERIDGGGNNLENLELLPKEEHLLRHYLKWLDGENPKEVRRREFDTATGRLRDLNDEELKTFYDLVEERTGVKVRFL